MTLPPIPPIIITTTHMQSTFLSNPPESSSQPEGEQTKIDKVKKAMSSKDAEEESIKSNFDDETTHVPGSMKIEEEAKVEAARHKGEIRKEELIDLYGPEVGPITLKVYREDDTSEIIPEFKANDLHLGEWIEVVTFCPNKKGKGWTSIYKQIQERMDYLRTTEAELGIDLDRPLTNKRSKSLVQYKDHPASIVFNEPVLGLDDHARTFSSLLLAEIDKRNMNLLKQIRVIKQLRQ
ncbi:hypothetical protein Tco_0347719 [Tanacetum coccineum]